MEFSFITKIRLIVHIIWFHIRWLLQNYSNGQSNSVACLVGKTAIITGGNSGIGYATAVLLASRGCKIILACRRDAKDVVDSIIKLTGNANISTAYLDLTKLKSVREFAQNIKKSESRIDILINNAGTAIETKFCTEDGLNIVMQVNYFGHFLLTHLLVDLLRVSNSARVVFLGSIAAMQHSLDDLKNLNVVDGEYLSASEYFTNYSNSKVCAVLAGQEFCKKLRKYGIVVTCVDPGVTLTPITRQAFNDKITGVWKMKYFLESFWWIFKTDIYRAAQCSFHVATSNEIQSGEYYFRCKLFIKPCIVNDAEFCKNIWEKSERLVHLNKDERLI